VNLVGIDVAGLDVPAFIGWSRLAFVALAVAFLALARTRGPSFLLLGMVAANAFVWAITNYPLQRIYALGPSRDRIGNLALVQVVASGNSPLHTQQVGQLHFEPFWGLLVAAASGWSPDRVLALYPFLPLLMAAGFVLTLYWGLGARGAEEESHASADAAWSPWERILAAGFATLLASAPLDHAGTYRVAWVMTFLLKPNHALALVLFPVFLRVFVTVRGWRGRLAAGALLHLMGWAFVLHMAYVCAGLVLYAALPLLARRPGARRDVLDVAVVLGTNLLVVSPYLVMLLVGYPFLDPNPAATISPPSPHLLETTLRHAPVFLLGAWGAWVAYRRGDRLGRAFSTQMAAAHLVWISYLALSALQQARERDEIFYWTRFLTAAAAGIGAWDLASRAAAAVGRTWAPSLRAAAIALLALPWSLPAWWDPLRLDDYFAGSLTPLPRELREPMEFLRSSTDPRAVVAGDRDAAKWVAALGARRVLLTPIVHMPGDYLERDRLERLLVQEGNVAETRRAAARFGVRYLLVTPALLERLGTTLDALRGLPHLRLAHLSGTSPEFVAIFEVR
jgi:hypothetical protein